MALTPGCSRDGAMALAPLASVARYKSSVRRSLMSIRVIAEVFVRALLLARSLLSVGFNAYQKTVIIPFSPLRIFYDHQRLIGIDRY